METWPCAVILILTIQQSDKSPLICTFRHPFQPSKDYPDLRLEMLDTGALTHWSSVGILVGSRVKKT